MDNLTIGLVSLGCDKNRVDSEIILSQLNTDYKIVSDAKNADVLIVNTCGFIDSAKEESINTILEMAEYKKNRCKVLVVTGCLSQRYGEELLTLIPEIDVLLGVNDYSNFPAILNNFISKKEKIVSCNYSDININEGKRLTTTGKVTSYIRISEGCDNFCTYCIIPKIRGKYRSRKIENILEEASQLVKSGTKELILIAQDTTRYGIDIYGEKKLPFLLKKLSEIPELKWIRLLYCYPEEITEELILEIKNNEKVCNYLDMPIQHINDEILKRMARRGNKSIIIKNINRLRELIPNIVIRTSVIVGFPGETQDNFEELKEFISEYKFDKLGVFKYSQEEGTIAADMGNQIEEEVKLKRYDEIMCLQQQISKSINNTKIGMQYPVLIESKKNSNNFVGRSYEMSPEIDGNLYFSSSIDLSIGDYVNVKIISSLEYDLIGVV